MKEEIRSKLKSERGRFAGENRKSADGKILVNFLNAFSGCQSFFIYNSFGSEADTSRIINALLQADKRVYLPRVEGDNIVAVPYGKTRRGAFGIEEPEGRAFADETEVTVIPLLAVNGRGFRIGYGGGFYDRYLRGRRTLKVGLGYSFQIEEFEEDGWDIPLDLFLCENGLYKYGNR